MSSIKTASVPELSYGLRGTLQVSGKGWLMLDVPNDIGHGAFKALGETGVELPVSETRKYYSAHISVMRPEELEGVGGPDAVHERGQQFRYTLGPVRTVVPDSWSDMSRVWFIEVHSPELERLRRSYGLSSLPNKGKHKFHITFACRRKGVLGKNEISKRAAAPTLVSMYRQAVTGECRELLSKAISDKR